ncbi:MAG: type II secretion system GspH family protein [Kineothrix sp.]|nr:type II secretion system GspH family protein [Kineothrix sp.]
MKKYRIRRIKGKSGMTLVELVVSMLLVSIIMAMVVGILSPAAKIFLRMQRLHYAQQILDNTAAQLRNMAGEATKYVKIYKDAENIVNSGGEAKGPVLEFVNPEGYTTLISADGSPEMDLVLESTKIDMAEEVEKGRLVARYYNIVNIATNEYNYTQGGKEVARAVAGVFTDGYYMGNYLKIEFSYPPGVGADDSPVTYLEAKLSLYNNEDRQPEHLVAQEEVVLDFRYTVVRRDGVTATNG